MASAPQLILIYFSDKADIDAKNFMYVSLINDIEKANLKKNIAQFISK